MRSQKDASSGIYECHLLVTKRSTGLRSVSGAGARSNAPLEASLDGYAAILRVHVDHTNVAQHRAALIRRSFGAQRAKVRVVRLECVEERVARGDGREFEGRWDQGQSRHGCVTIWEERRVRRRRHRRLSVGVREETSEDG